MAVKYNSYDNYAVVPKLPTYRQPYRPQQNTDPSAYYTKALGFIPIDTRYMVNTTNNLAYNSMADVLFNKAAQDKRWANTPWMQGVLNPLRIVADTFLLGKDTIIDPIVQGAIDDGFKGLMRGGSTALMNSLVNLGNTLDIVSNPIKGLVLEGGTGFVKGLVGDEYGRKQYDYNEYIDTGVGAADFLLSLGAEIISDPLNLISFGGKKVIELGADTVADAVTKSIKTALKEALDKSVKSIDELVPVFKNTKYTKSLTDDAAKTVLKDAFGETAENLTEESVKTFTDNVHALLKKTISGAEIQGGTKSAYSKLAQSLSQSKTSRYKASLFSKGIEMTPAVQKYVSNYLLNAGTTVPDLMGSSLNNAIKYGGKLYRGAENVEKSLRYIAGATGLDEIIGLTKLGRTGAGLIRNTIAKADPNVIKTMNDVFNHLDYHTKEAAVEILEATPNLVTNKGLIDNIYNKLGAYQKLLSMQDFSKASVSNIQVSQKKVLKEINELVKELKINNVNTFDDYLKYLTTNNAILKDSSVTQLINNLTDLNKMLSEDFTNKAVLKRYKNARLVKINSLSKQMLGQQQQMAHGDKLLNEFNQKYKSTTLDELNTHNEQLDEVIEAINNETLLDSLRYNIVPKTLTQLNAEKVHPDIIDTFEQTWNDFVENLKHYENDPTDIYFKDNFVQSYKSLNEQLNSFIKYDTADGVTATNATEIKNLLGMAWLERNKEIVPQSDALKTLVKHGLSESEAEIIIKRAHFLQRLYNEPQYQEVLAFYKTNKDFITEVKSARDSILKSYNTKNLDVLKLFKQAERIDAKYPNLPIIDTTPLKVYNTPDMPVLSKSDLAELHNLIEELPTASTVKPLSTFINPEDVRKYKLVFYSYMHQKNSFLHAQLGLKLSAESFLSNESPAYLAEFINECKRTTGALHHILNDVSIDPNSFDGGVIKQVKDLINRLDEYTNLYNYIVDTAYNLGFDDTTVEALLDAMRTQLDRTGYITERHLQTVVEDVLAGANLHLKNRFETPSLALDRVFRQTVNTLSTDPGLPANYRAALNRIQSRLDAGMAHGAVADVDNLTDLIDVTRARAITDSRLVGMRRELLRIAAGRNIIVFDIESTGANEAAAHIYQIAGKVLDTNGKEIPGSRFNYIIRPPKDVDIKPTGLLLETLAAKGEDANLWWKNNIVNAETIEGVQTVFDDLDSAVKAFEDHCSKHGSFVLAGHNITNYDVPALIQRSSIQNSFLQTAEKFDTLKYMNNSIYQIADDPAIIFKKQLTDKLMSLIDNNSVLLEQKVFNYTDVSALMQFKELLKDNYKELFTFSKKDKKILYAQGVGYIDESTGKTVLNTSGVDESSAIGFDLEKTINGILEAWRAPAKLNKTSTKYFVVSKLNPDDFSDTTIKYFKELADKGLINVAPGTNIVQYLNANVKTGHIVINPVRVVSYEVEEIFDLQKALKVYGTPVGFKNRLNIKHAAELNRHYKYIQAKRNILPLDYVKHVRETANLFLKLVDNDYVKVLRDNVDDLTIVATAQYTYSRLKHSKFLESLEYDKLIDEISQTHNGNFLPLEVLDDTWGTVATLRGYEDYVPTPILNQVDEATGVSKAVWEDKRFFSYDKIVDVLSKDPFDEIRTYNIEHNLFNVYSAAKHTFYETLYNNAKEVSNYLDSLDETQRIVAEKALRAYNTKLDTNAISEIITRSDRVKALKDEAFIRGGYVCFETDAMLKLDDFKADKGFIVVDNVKTANNKYVHFICATRETFESAKDLELAVYTIKGVEGVDDELYEHLVKFRQIMANNGVKNIGYSHGDIIKDSYIDTIHSALRRAGVSDEVIDLLPSVDDLTASGFFDIPRANNSIIGSRSLWEFITNDSDIHIISDPFKQLLYSAKSGIVTGRERLIRYCSLILNEHSDIAKAAIFKDISDVDLYDLLKKNDDFCMVYITKTGKWDHTKSGLIVKEFDLVNAASIKRAREMGGIHIIPRTQAAQLMQAVNEFELPPIAKVAKAISDVYKVAYLGSLGFIVRNIIDSNYKTYASLNGQVSLPKSVSHFFQTMTLVRKHTNVGQEYTKAMGRYFTNDLDYAVFYHYCTQYNNSNLFNELVTRYGAEHKMRIQRQLNKLNTNISSDVVNKIKSDLIQPELFSIVDAFINHGPSAGLSKSILNNIPGATKTQGVNDVADAINVVNNWITEKTPAKFVFSFNDTVEQAARLSMFLQRLELGDTIDDANKAIIKAHFDYSDKSIGMLYTEILFPFMSFSYKNLNFWIEMMYKNPLLVGQLENIFRTVFDYQSLFNPDQEAYKDYDYTFDWSKDVVSFESNAPWTMINAARLYHILNGNILIKHGDNVQHDAGYGEKENELYTVFKLSPSVLDATKMLFTPLNTYSERLLPPAEPLANTLLNVLSGKSSSDQVGITTLTNMLPYVDTIIQRIGLDEKGLKHNNIFKRIEDAGVHQAIPSMFGAAYVPVKDNHYYYDSDYNILGGFKTNYYAKRNYSNPYNSKYPSYTLTRMAQNKKPKDIYAKSKTNRIYKQQYNNIVRNISYNSLRYRLKDYKYYY